jgi:recombination protein RecA
MAKSSAPKKSINVINTPEEKRKALKTAMDAIEKQFGAGAVMFMGGENSKLNVEAVSTGSLGLDLALGIGGLPKGRIVEIYGPESGGKTTVSLHAIAQAQKNGGIAAFIDVEHALDPVYAKKLGVDIDNLIVSQPDTGEQALDIIESLTRSGAIDIIVLDSVAAMVTKAEIDGNIGDSTVGVQARLMSAAMRRLTSVISKTNTVAIFINQVREKIGVMYGNPETTPGGRALKFYASVRIEVRKGTPIKEKDVQIGVRTKCKVVKNKVAPPFKAAEFDLIFGEGISKIGEVLDLATELDIIRKSGAWFNYNDIRLGQGRENAKKFLLENPDLAAEIENKVRENADIVLEMAAASASDDTDDAIESIPTPVSSTTKKKNVVIQADEDFEEFSPDDLM